MAVILRSLGYCKMCAFLKQNLLHESIHKYVMPIRDSVHILMQNLQDKSCDSSLLYPLKFFLFFFLENGWRSELCQSIQVF